MFILDLRVPVRAWPQLIFKNKIINKTLIKSCSEEQLVPKLDFEYINGKKCTRKRGGQQKPFFDL